MPRFDEKGSYIEPTDKQIWRAGKTWAIVGVAAVILIPFAVWGLSVLFSDPAGRGNQIKQINRAENRTFAQEQFQQLLNDIKAYDQQIAVAGKAVDEHPTQDTERERLSQVYFGLQNQCINVSAQYNAEAQKISKEKFRDADLPERIDGTDPATDCKENAS